MKSRTSAGERVRSTQGSHSRRPARLRSTAAKIGSASQGSNRRISMPGATVRRNMQGIGRGALSAECALLAGPGQILDLRAFAVDPLRHGVLHIHLIFGGSDGAIRISRIAGKLWFHGPSLVALIVT